MKTLVWPSMEHKRIIFILLIFKAWRTDSITTRREDRIPVRNFRRHVGSPPTTNDWEAGLRVAVHQALVRERYSDPHLREHLQTAPFIGKQDSALPFGDIVILARGQLYSTHEGYKFIQDPYQNDCDDCHNERNRCSKYQCVTWQPQGNEQLLALWTVKRIRHRDIHYGHKFELEYVISPISAALSEGFVTRNGRFDYTVPGHIFVIKIGNYENYNTHRTDHKQIPYHKPRDPLTSTTGYEDHHIKHQNPFRPGILVGISPNGYKHILHSFPGFYTSFPEYLQTPPLHEEPLQIRTTSNPNEIRLYKSLIDTLASKTTPSETPKFPHRFSLSPPSKTWEKSQTKGILVQTTEATKQQITEPYTHTLSQLPKSQISVSMATPPVITQETTKQHRTTIYLPTVMTTPAFVHLISTQPNKIMGDTAEYNRQPHKTSTSATRPELDLFHITQTPQIKYRNNVLVTTQKHTPILTQVPKFDSPKPIQPPITTIHYYTPIEEDIFPKGKTTIPTKFSEKINYYRKTTTPMKQKPHLYPHEKFSMFTTTKTIPKRPQTDDDSYDFNFPPETSPTKSMKQEPGYFLKHPDSINEQLPPPSKNTDITIPYVLNTVTQSSFYNRLQESTRLELTTQKEKPKTSTSLRVDGTTNIVIPSMSTRIPVTSVKTSSTSDVAKTTKPLTTTASTTKLPQTTVPTTRGLYFTIISEPETTHDELTTSAKLSTTTKPTDIEDTIKVTNFPSQPTFYIEPELTSNEYFSYEKASTPTTLNYNTINVPVNTIHLSTETYPSINTTETPIIITNEPTNTYILSETPSYIITSTDHLSTLEYVPTPTSKGYTSSNTKPSSGTTFDYHQTTTKKKSYKSDINEDDIFGNTKPFPEKTKGPTRKTTLSDLAYELFGDQHDSQDKTATSTSMPGRTPKIIYSNFFEASTLPPTTPMFNVFDHQPEHITESTSPTTKYTIPATSQSYSTSISFQVNKKNRSKHQSDAISVEEIRNVSMISAKLSEIMINGSDTKIHKAEMVGSDEEVGGKQDTKKELDNVALQLINHARSIDYLSAKSTTKNPKNKRIRSYIPKSRRIPKKQSQSQSR